MPTINVYSELNDGIIKASGGGYNTQREATSGTVSDNLTGGNNLYGEVSFTSRSHTVTRAFFLFDVSGITTATAVSLQLVGTTIGDNYGNFVVVRGTAFGMAGAGGSTPGQDLEADDFNNIFGWDGSSSMDGQASLWSSEPAVATAFWETGSTINSIHLGIDAAVNSSTYISLALVNYKYDYLKVAPSMPSGEVGNAWAYRVGGYHRDVAQVPRRPYLSIITLATDYDNSVNTVLAANIGKVNTVATANIETINTV